MIGYRQSAVGVDGWRSASAIGGRRRLSVVSVDYWQSASAIGGRRRLSAVGDRRQRSASAIGGRHRLFSDRRRIPTYLSLVGLRDPLITWFIHFVTTKLRSQQYKCTLPITNWFLSITRGLRINDYL